MKRLALVLLLLIIVAPVHATTPILPGNVEIATRQSLGLTVYKATVQLPRGCWSVADVKPGGALEHAFVIASEDDRQPIGQRTQAHEIEKKLKETKGVSP